MFWKKWIKAYFSFSRRDRLGLLCLFLLGGIIYALPRFFRQEETRPLEFAAVKTAIDSLDAGQRAKKLPALRNGWERQDHTPDRHPPAGDLFRFNPNTLSTQGWQKLGLSERTARTIENYRKKGGRFYKPEDLARIWGLPGGFYQRVKDYIDLPSSPASSGGPPPSLLSSHVSRKPPGPIRINEADTTDLIALPGIGSKLAARIVGFREKLGGFYSVEQIKEVYGLQDSIFQKIRGYLQPDGIVRKFNLNTVSKEELKAHPYFKWALANAIVEYRNQHGSFTSLEDLKKIVMIDEPTLNRIVNYLRLQ